MLCEPPVRARITTLTIARAVTHEGRRPSLIVCVRAHIFVLAVWHIRQ